MPAGCNLRLVKALALGLPILYNHIVKQVKYEQAGVSVIAGNTVIQGNIFWPFLCQSLISCTMDNRYKRKYHLPLGGRSDA